MARVLLLALPLLVLGACASGGGMDAGGDENEATLQVENNLLPPTSLSVYLVSDVGTRRMIGSVSPSQTRNLSINLVQYEGEYRLVAETTSGNDIASRTFYIGGNIGTISWDLNSNLVTVR